MSSQRSTSSLPPASVSRVESIAPGASAATGASSMAQAATFHPSPFTLHPSPFTLHPSHCGLRAAAVPQLEIEVARVDENSQSLAPDGNPGAAIEGKKQ